MSAEWPETREAMVYQTVEGDHLARVRGKVGRPVRHGNGVQIGQEEQAFAVPARQASTSSKASSFQSEPPRLPLRSAERGVVSQFPCP